MTTRYSKSNYAFQWLGNGVRSVFISKWICSIDGRTVIDIGTYLLLQNYDENKTKILPISSADRFE